MRAIRVRAPAKLNLQLSVGGLRRDGYHDLATVFHAVGLYDEIAVRPARDLTIRVEGEHADGVPVGPDNLAARAATLLAERAGVDPAVRITLRKGIPVSAGLAGGSADAAGALVACDALWGAGLPRAALLELATDLGSDVPFALVGGTAVGTGRGTVLTPALARGHFSWVLALAATGLSTPAVYAEADRLRRHRILPEPRVSDALMAALRAGDPGAVAGGLDNDLQPAACSLRPELIDVLAAGRSGGALGAIVSGSGPTCAFLARDGLHAEDIASGLRSAGCCSSVHSVEGPVPGARVVEVR